MAETTIEWARYTFNPWTGCTRVSPGCDHCYAEGWAKRSGHVEWGAHAPRRRTADAYWREPLKWNARAQEEGRRARVFCASLADVFDNHASILPQWRADLWSLIAATPHLDWLLLTKRPQNIAKMLPPTWGDGWPNVWLGTTVENQTEANRRIPYLLNTPARVRFLSCEPLLGPVDLTQIKCPFHGEVCAVTGYLGNGMYGDYGPKLDMVICGGESGPGARPMHPDWARSLRDQCAWDSVPFFFKQWGDWEPRRGFACPDDLPRDGWHHFDPECSMRRVGKKNAGRLLDGREWNDFPITKGPCGEEQAE
jgi:protein gp37